MENDAQADWLDRQLREATPYIDDAGFTRQVLAKLPAPRVQTRAARSVILIALTIIGTVIAYVLSDGGLFITKGLLRLALFPMPLVLLAALVTGILVTGIGLAAVLSKSHELQS